ncbi:MAG: VanW family protein [Clostridia bacterium]|nr:VanW family protein [Clostridia bacterium]
MKMMRVVFVCLVCLALCVPAAQADTYLSYDGGYAETSIAGATISQLTNIYRAAEAINGCELTSGQRFSFNDAVGPRTVEAGYQIAENGRGARVRGGGVSQVATTLLMAVEDFGWMDVEDYTTYGDKFTGGYVADGDRAVVTDYAAGHDLAFQSFYPGVVMIEAWVTDNALCVALTGYDGWAGADYRALAEGSTPMPYEYGQTQNVRLASSLIDGCELSYGEKFSFNGVVGPRTAAAGFVNATNGRGVTVTGGGVAQVASTIYLAAKQLDSVTIDPVRTYGDRFTGGYVADSADAVVTDYNAGIDFSFTYYGAGTLVISLYDSDGTLWCCLYESSGYAE